MKKTVLSLAFFILISLTNSIAQRESRLKNMYFMPAGEIVKDSINSISFNSFWLSSQITNKEFKEFWNYAKNNTDEELIWAEMSYLGDSKEKHQPIIKKIKYSELLKDSLSKKNWPTEFYFESEEFNDRPVIGVSSNLAAHYCIWKTTKTYEGLEENERNPVSPYFVPTTSQLEYSKKIKPDLFTIEEVGFRIVIME